MNTPVLTAGQHEFAAIFERLEGDFKMSKAAVARALQIERSYVSMLINGQRTPSLRLLQSMRELAQRIQAERTGTTPPTTTGAGATPDGETELNRLFKLIQALEQADPPTFQAVRTVVTSLAQNSAAKGTSATGMINSKSASAASKLLKKASASVHKRVAK